jgi:hypothetical protein
MRPYGHFIIIADTVDRRFQMNLIAIFAFKQIATISRSILRLCGGRINNGNHFNLGADFDLSNGPWKRLD